MAKGKVAQRQDCMPPVADGGGKELEDKARPEATCMDSRNVLNAISQNIDVLRNPMVVAGQYCIRLDQGSATGIYSCRSNICAYCDR